MTETLALKLKVKGLLNIQFAIQNGKVYVLEVNPRASRTVPFVSKSTGIPLAKIAARLMIGMNLKDVLPPIRPQPFVAVKESVLPWDRFPGTDVRLSPEMRSTGEVMGMDTNFPMAFFKSQLAAGSNVPMEGNILFSLTNVDKDKSLSIVKELVALGFKIMATDGTFNYFKNQGLPAEQIKKISQGRPNVVDAIKNRQVQIVVNTPSQTSTSQGDGYQIRQAALKYRLPIFTTLSSLNAFKDSILQLKKKGTPFTVSSLQDFFRSN